MYISIHLLIKILRKRGFSCRNNKIENITGFSDKNYCYVQKIGAPSIFENLYFSYFSYNLHILMLKGKMINFPNFQI